MKTSQVLQTGFCAKLCIIIVVIIGVLIGLFNTNKLFVYKSAVERTFNLYPNGVLCVDYPDGTYHKFGINKDIIGCSAEMKIHSDEFFEAVATSFGNIGLGEAYFNNLWEPVNASDLQNVLYFLASNQWATKGHSYSRLIIQNMFNYGDLSHWIERRFLTKKTKDEDIENVMYHYDELVDANFFEKYMSNATSGSSAIFTENTTTLEQAQINKWTIIIKKLNIKSNMTILDVGSGWGYFCYLVNYITHANCIGITLSPAQYNYAVDRFERLLCDDDDDDNHCLRYYILDYRDISTLNVSFDRIVSVEMISHIGYKNNDIYFNTLYSALKPNGYMLIQGMVMADVYYKYRPTKRSTACQQTNFISKYIFPGGCIQNMDWINEAALDAGFQIIHIENFGKHYAKTCQAWNDGMKDNWHELGKRYSLKKYKLHEYYFQLCVMGFHSTRVDVAHIVYYKPALNENNIYRFQKQWLQRTLNPNQFEIRPFQS